MSNIDIRAFLVIMADVIEIYARELSKLAPEDRDDALSMVLGSVLKSAADENMDPEALQDLHDATAERILSRVSDIDGLAGREIAGHA